MGFNYHRNIKGPCCTGVWDAARQGDRGAPSALPSLPHSCLHRLRGSEQPESKEMLGKGKLRGSTRLIILRRDDEWCPPPKTTTSNPGMLNIGMTGKRDLVPRDKTSRQKVLLYQTKILLQPSSMAQMEWLLFWDQEIKIALLSSNWSQMKTGKIRTVTIQRSLQWNIHSL